MPCSTAYIPESDTLPAGHPNLAYVVTQANMIACFSIGGFAQNGLNLVIIVPIRTVDGPGLSVHGWCPCQRVFMEPYDPYGSGATPNDDEVLASRRSGSPRGQTPTV